MFCEEKILRVYEMRLRAPYQEEWHDSFLQVTYRLQYHTTDGYWLVAETENHYITLGVGGVRIARGAVSELSERFEIEEYGADSVITTLLLGEHLVDVRQKKGYTKLLLEDLSMELYEYTRQDWRWFEHINHLHGYLPLVTRNNLFLRRCSCGGRGEALLDHVEDYVVRCKRCHRSTRVAQSFARAVADWNDGETTCICYTDFEELTAQLQREDLQYIAVSRQGLIIIDEKLWETDALILAFEKEKYLLSCQRKREDETEFSVLKVSDLNPEEYRRVIRPSDGGRLYFVECGRDFGSRELRLHLDDTEILIRSSNDLSLEIGISCVDRIDYETTKRRTLLI